MLVRLTGTRYRGPALLALAAAVAVTAGTMASSAPARAVAEPDITTLLAWGANNGGQLGNGGTTAAPSPVSISLPSGTDVAGIAAGATHTLMDTASGDLFAWGTNNLGQLGNNTRTSSTTPAKVAMPSGATQVISVAAGNGFSLAATLSGQLYAWGGNGSGQLGDGTSTTRLTPELISVPGATFSKVSAGTAFSLGLTTDHRVFAWGGNRDGELGNLSGNGSSTPEQVTFPVPAGTLPIDVEAGGNFALALMSNGTVYAWGDGADGQLGDNSTANSAPVQVQLGNRAPVAIAAGGTTGYAITPQSGIDFAWGDNSAGQLGDGEAETSSLVPVQMSLGNSNTSVGPVLTGIAAGAQSAQATTSAGAELAWGTGPIGAGSGTFSAVPVGVSLPSGQQPVNLSQGPDAASAFAGSQASGSGEFVTLGCDVFGSDGRGGGEHLGTCSSRTAASSYTVDFTVSNSIGAVTWLLPAGVTVSSGCTSSSTTCAWTVSSSTALRSFTTGAEAADVFGDFGEHTVVTSLPAVCGSAFC